MIALSLRIQQYRKLHNGQDPALIVLSAKHFTQLSDEAGDGTYQVPVHQFPNTFLFQKIWVLADPGILREGEPFLMLERAILPASNN